MESTDKAEKQSEKLQKTGQSFRSAASKPAGSQKGTTKGTDMAKPSGRSQGSKQIEDDTKS